MREYDPVRERGHCCATCPELIRELANLRSKVDRVILLVEDAEKRFAAAVPSSVDPTGQGTVTTAGLRAALNGD